MFQTAVRPKPEAHEKQADFVDRCQRELLYDVPDIEDRNAMAYQLWRESKGADDIEQRAYSRFTDQEFVHVENVPVFAEHTTKDKDGNLVVYDRSALQVICDRCNTRIADTGDFPPITAGHTPSHSQLDRGVPQPDVLGYSGPFRMGMIGNKNPRWAIISDEWHHRDEAERLRKLRRRSPEVWLEDRMEDRFLDPIAALGAETPRLDMGLTRLCRSADGRIVEKYTAVAPGPGSVFVPSEDYQSDQKGTVMLSPEDIQQITDAIMQTDAMQWVKSQMGSEAPATTADEGIVPGGEAPEGPPVPPMADEAPPAPAAPAAPPMEEESENYMGADAGASMPNEDPLGKYGAEEDESTTCDTDQKQEYSAEGSAEDPQAGSPTEAATVADSSLMKFSKGDSAMSREHYSRLERTNREQQAEIQQLKSRLDKADREKSQASRYSKLQSLRQEFAFDLEEEANYCNSMSDEQFDRHTDRIVANYSRIPVELGVHVPEATVVETESTKEKYQRQLNDKAMEIAESAQKAGRYIKYDEALDEAKKALA